MNPRTSEITEQQFRAILNVPGEHELRCIEHTLTGMDGWEWIHEERDRLGQLVARYVTSLNEAAGSVLATYFWPGPDGIVERTIELRGRSLDLYAVMAATKKSGERRF